MNENLVGLWLNWLVHFRRSLIKSRLKELEAGTESCLIHHHSTSDASAICLGKFSQLLRSSTQSWFSSDWEQKVALGRAELFTPVLAPKECLLSLISMSSIFQQYLVNAYMEQMNASKDESKMKSLLDHLMSRFQMSPAYLLLGTLRNSGIRLCWLSSQHALPSKILKAYWSHPNRF